jgi:hypothetical protein
MLIGIAGAAGSGKDTVADFLVQHHAFCKLSWAGPLKAGLAAMGMAEPADRADKEKPVPGFDFTWREAAQKLGTEWGRALDPNIWIKMAARKLDQHPNNYWVISDVRFSNEADMIRERGGFIIFVNRPGAELAKLGASESQHASEKGVMVHPDRDVIIINDGTMEDLYLKVEDEYLSRLAFGAIK